MDATSPDQPNGFRFPPDPKDHEPVDSPSRSGTGAPEPHHPEAPRYRVRFRARVAVLPPNSWMITIGEGSSWAGDGNHGEPDVLHATASVGTAIRPGGMKYYRLS